MLTGGGLAVRHAVPRGTCELCTTSCICVCASLLQNLIPFLAVSLYSLLDFKIVLQQRKDLSWIHHVVLNKQGIFKSQQTRG